MKKVGIIKGGQLGRMLIQAGIDYGISAHVLEPDAEAPCRDLCDRFVVGDLLDEETVYQFGRSVDVLTFEFEHVNLRALERLEAEGKAVHPGSRVMAIAGDKGRQKEFFMQNGIPTADFMLITGRSGLERADLSFPCVQKTRTAGYDGRGVQALESPRDIPRAWDVPSVIERKIDFEKEISVIVARDRFGSTASYTPAEMSAYPGQYLLDRLFYPARIPAALSERASAIARELAVKLDLVGVLAVEMFVTRSGEVLVNEIAPRAHNTGHQTIESSVTSQYAQQIRCVLGLPLGSVELVRPSVMINLIGEPGFEGPVKYVGIDEVLRTEGVHLHLYGKTLTRPYRKMGHITITGHNIQSAEEKSKWVQSQLKVTS
jgi:5-(carboxyamino)imidazole ribonucleotide synthase